MQEIQDTLVTYRDALLGFLPKLGIGLVILLLGLLLANLVRNILLPRMLRRMDDPLLARFLGRIVKTAILILAVFFAFYVMGLTWIAGSLLTGASVSALVVGFAFKDIGENFLAGIMLAFDRPFRVGDIVEISGQQGKIVGLALRTTRIKSFDGKDIYVPNAAVVKNPVINYTIDGYLRYDFPVGLDYGSDVSEAIEVIMATLRNIDGILWEEKAPSVSVSSLNPSTVNLTVYFWLNTFDESVSAGNVRTHAIDQCLTALGKAGFYLPGDVIELKNYNDQELRGLAGNLHAKPDASQ